MNYAKSIINLTTCCYDGKFILLYVVKWFQTFWVKKYALTLLGFCWQKCHDCLARSSTGKGKGYWSIYQVSAMWTLRDPFPLRSSSASDTDSGALHHDDCCFSVAGSAYKLVCYFTNWSQYRPEPANFFPKDVDPCLCTHLIYAFATMNDNKIAPYEWNDIDVLYPEFQALKEQSVGVESKVMGISEGEWRAQVLSPVHFQIS